MSSPVELFPTITEDEASSHIESEFTILSEEDYAMSDEPPEDGPGSISWEVEQNNRLGLRPNAFYCGLDIAD